MTQILKKTMALATAAAIAASLSTGAMAAPLGNFAGAHVKNAVPQQTTDVRYRRWWPGYVAAGVGLGILGAGIAASAYPYGYYGPPPGYYGPGPGPQQCWVQTGPYRGQGYWAWC
jgi:hypothetical protein